jgi:uncharacterized protein (DUF3820 family)
LRPDDFQLLVTREMPFGKYKGRCIADLPGNYLTWFVREGLLQYRSRHFCIMLIFNPFGPVTSPSFIPVGHAPAYLESMTNSTLLSEPRTSE